MTQKDYEIAKALKAKISKVAPLIDFRVFGSRARGDNEEHSDMDVFIEVESLDRQLKKKIREIIWEIGFVNAIYISPLFFTRFEIEKTPLKVSPIVENIYEEGVKL